MTSVIHYKAYDVTGKPVNGTLNAADEKHAYLKLSEMGLAPVSVRMSSSRLTTTGSSFFQIGSPKRIEKTKVVLEFISALSDLLAARFDVKSALQTLSTYSNQKLAKLAEQVKTNIESGKSFSQALTELKPSFPEDIIAIARSGEASNQLAEVLQSYVSIETSKTELRGEIGSALVYPAFVFIVAFGVLTIISYSLATSLVDIFILEGKEPPVLLVALSTYASFISSDLFRSSLIGALVLLLVISLTQKQSGKKWFKNSLLQLPWVGAIFKDWEIARILANFGLLMKHRVPILEIIASLERSCELSKYSQAFSKIKNAVQNGSSLGAAFEANPVFPELVLHGIRIGEKSNTLAETSERLSKLYTEKARKAGSRLSAVLTPIITIVVGLFVGAVVLSTMNALLSINELAL